VLDSQSQCAILPYPGAFVHNPKGPSHEGCWHPRAFEKAVVIVIDALRYDFTVPFHRSSEHPTPRYFHNAIPILHQTAEETPENAFLLPFIADPPTTTLQRLKGLTTGTLPTFIEAGSNFAGTAIEEDNVLLQLRKVGKTLVHLGDDTWNSLFPGYFHPNLTHAYDSFNVRDLHTVDNGVIEHLIPLLQSSAASEWDVIFGHFLGVDHAGHRYGPDHQAMTVKLKQMDGVIRDIIQSIDEKTLLVVMGDHGMDGKGDHGGESDEEVEAAIWFYSRRPIFGRTQPSFVVPPPTAKERPIRQIDLVPTLALLLGVPIPFSNLGKPIEEAFIGAAGNDWKNLALVNRLSESQIRRYRSEYWRAGGETTSDYGMMPAEFELVSNLEALQDWKALYNISRSYQQETLQVFRGLWAKFDIPGMIHGIEILAGALISLLIYSHGLEGDKSDFAPLFLRNVGLGSVSGAIFAFAVSTLTPSFGIISGVLYYTGTGGILGCWLSFFQLRENLQFPIPRSTWGWLTFIFTLSQAAGFAANSYTIHEDSILLFFLTTFGILSCISSQRQLSKPDRLLGTYHSLLFVILTRFASFSRLCREEQMPQCRSTFYASSTSSASAPWHLFIPYATAIFLPEIIKAFYRGTASYEGSAGFWIGFCFRMGLLLVAAYWTIDAAETAGWFADTISATTLDTTSVTIARCVLGAALAAGLATFVFAKPCINVSLSTRTRTLATPPNPTTNPTKTQVTIYGYANVYGARYYLLLPILILITALLLPPMGQFSLAICAWQILCLLEILDTNGLTIFGPASSSAIGPIVLAMLGSYHFFKTGHQAVLSSIQWNSAYVPLRTLHYPWSPLFVVINSFGAQMLCAAAVPLTVLWKRPVNEDKKKGMKGLWGDMLQACLSHVMYYATIQLATTLWAGHLRRHLMLYRVFMPRFLLGCIVLVVVDVVLVVVALMAVRVSALSVGEVFGF
jgi:phosphatidylinositol glycan class O